MDQAESLRTMTKNIRARHNDKPSYGTPGLTITAITGGKGGVGKSNIALNLGLSLTGLGERVCLLDADFGLANIDVLMGIKPKFHIGHVMNSTKTLQEIMVEGPGGLKLIPAASGLKHLAGLPEHQLMSFLNQAKDIGKSFDRLIIDTPAGISGDVLTFLRGAGEIIFIVTPEPTSFTDAFALMKIMRFEKQNLRVKIIMNMCPEESFGRRKGEQLVEICQNFLGFKPELIGVLVMDTNVGKAIRKQAPFLTLFPKTDASVQIGQAARKLKQSSIRESDLGGFFSSMRDFVT